MGIINSSIKDKDIKTILSVIHKLNKYIDLTFEKYTDYTVKPTATVDCDIEIDKIYSEAASDCDIDIRNFCKASVTIKIDSLADAISTFLNSLTKNEKNIVIKYLEEKFNDKQIRNKNLFDYITDQFNVVCDGNNKSVVKNLIENKKLILTNCEGSKLVYYNFGNSEGNCWGNIIMDIINEQIIIQNKLNKKPQQPVQEYSIYYYIIIIAVIVIIIIIIIIFLSKWTATQPKKAW